MQYSTTSIGGQVHTAQRTRKILIDDNALPRCALRAMLERDTVQGVAAAASGQTRLQAGRRERNALIVLDFTVLDLMPCEADGLTLPEAINKA